MNTKEKQITNCNVCGKEVKELDPLNGVISFIGDKELYECPECHLKFIEENL